MIKELTIYTVICDSCGKDSADGTDYAGWNDKEFTVECAMEDNWIKEDENHYCPECYGFDDDGEIIIKNKQQP